MQENIQENKQGYITTCSICMHERFWKGEKIAQDDLNKVGNDWTYCVNCGSRRTTTKYDDAVGVKRFNEQANNIVAIMLVKEFLRNTMPQGK